MRYSETEQLFQQAFEFPVDHETVVGQLGEVELATPAGDAVTIRAVLGRTNEHTYSSPEGLYTSLLRNLEDGFIGRKYYDDRAGTASGRESVESDSMSL
jgi:hypothetical protein